MQHNGMLYNNFARSHADKTPQMDLANLIPVGEVARSGVMRNLQDFDAAKLPKGTPLYHLEGYENLLVEKSGEETFVWASLIHELRQGHSSQ